jgi:BirA family transcriptional regulator, biotin operon repressor / biotin---[acetyl-CoA-carboxylase] ligase
MTTLNHPTILTDLGHVGANGLLLSSATWFQHELELCKEWGFRLEITNNRVHLNFDQEQLVPYWIQKETSAIAWDWLRVKGFLRAGSTNNEAMDMARSGAPGGTLVYAEEQTDGKGRKGRSWFSPAQKGLYFTLILRPQQSRRSWPLLTHVTAVALAETLKTLTVDHIIPHPLNVDIKWPNDVLISGKKCAGILLESLSTDAGNPAAIVGLGINVHEGSVPDFLESEAVCLDKMAQTFVPRRQLMVRFLHHFQLCYLLFEKGSHEELLNRWKSMSSMWDGVPVWVTEGEVRRMGITCGLNEIGALLVRTTEGKTETIYAGDIRVRKDNEF